MSASKIPEVVPLAPDDVDELRRNWADVALGYNRRLPALEATVDEVKGIALSAHGVASATLDKTVENRAELARIKGRLEDLAHAVGAKRTYSSGQFAAVTSVPPGPPQPLEIKTRRTGTGSHWIIENDELQKIQAKWAEKEAEERGAKAYAAELEAENARLEAAAKAKRDRVAFWVGLLVVVGGFIGWALSHINVH